MVRRLIVLSCAIVSALLAGGGCDDGGGASPGPDGAIVDAAPATGPDACAGADCDDAFVLQAADFGGVADQGVPDAAPAALRTIDDDCSDLYDQRFVPTFEIEIAPEEWAALQDEFAHPREREAAGLPLKPYHPLLSFRYRDEEVFDAHIRLKGNPFYSWVPPKMQFVISFREVDRRGRFHGLRKIGLDAPWYDPTLLRERVATAFVREAGLPGACTNNARLLVNGQLYGVYANREHVDKEYLERVFDDPEGNLYKYGWELKTNESENDVARRDALLATRDLAEFERLVDRAAAVSAWAAEAMLPHYDGYWCCNHNYYVYDHPRRGFVWILHDLDIALDRGAPTTNLLTYGSRRPDHLVMAMADPGWRGDFALAVADLLPYYDPAEFERRLDAWSAQIAGAVRQDPNLPFEYAEHLAGVAHMRAWFRPRHAYLTEFVELATRCQRGEPGRDLDNDDVDECTDCDDLDRTVFPGAAEACNDRDDDCDGITDEGDFECGDCVAAAVEGADFVLCPAPQGWYDGYQSCGREGGQLAVPTATEAAGLREAARGLSEGGWWIGANDADEEERWVRVDGTPIEAPPWAENQPSGGSDQNCALLDPATGAWNDAECTNAHPVICRIEAR